MTSAKIRLYMCNNNVNLRNIMGDEILLIFGATFQHWFEILHVKFQSYHGNLPYVSVPRWWRSFKMLWIKMITGIKRRFRKPKRTKQHTKKDSNSSKVFSARSSRSIINFFNLSETNDCERYSLGNNREIVTIVDKARVKLFPNFTRHHLITHT